MSVPALRQPKFVTNQPETLKKTTIHSLHEVQYVIVTLKDEQKLVVSSDAYHGIITVGERYKCVFCQTEMELNKGFKEEHKNSLDHRKTLEKYPHVAEYSENLIRELTEDSSFCTICNVVVSNMHLRRHLTTEVHGQELQKAGIRAASYRPF